MSVEQASSALFGAFLLVLAIEYLGLAKEIPVLKTVRFTTLVAWALTIVALVRLGPMTIMRYGQLRWLLFLVLLTGASVAWAVVQSYVPPNFRYLLDYFALALTTAFVVDRSSRLTQLSAAFSVVVIVLVLRNADKLLSGVRVGAMQAGYFLADGNDLAWGLVTLLIFPLHLLVGKHGVLLRSLGLLGSVAAVGGIVGTQSRGASLALAAAVFMYWLLVSKRKLVSVVVVVVLAAGAAVVLPGSYVNRMKTLENYEEDSSAQGRLRAWKAAFSMAVTRPLGVGAGNFNSAYGRYYMPENAEGWGTARWISAHSVFFKMLGELGFPGLALLIAVVVTNVRDQSRMARLIAADPTKYQIQEQWPGLLAVGVVAYSVGGMFLGGVAYPHIFLLTGLTVACRRSLEAVESAPAVSTVPTAMATAPSLPTGRKAFGHQSPARGTSMATRRYAQFNRATRRMQ